MDGDCSESHLVKIVHQSNSLAEETVHVSARFGVQCSVTPTRGAEFEELNTAT